MSRAAWRRRANAAAMAALALVAAALVAGCGSGPEAPSAAAGADPDAGSWRTWVISSPSEIRVPPPPNGAATERTRVASDEDGGAVAPARPSSDDPAVRPWIELAMDLISERPKDPPAASRAYALVSVAMYDAVVAAWHWKDVYRERGAGAGVDDGGETAAEPDPSYPSEHAALAGAAARVLAYAFPEEPRARFEHLSREIVNARVQAGQSRPEDVRAGLALGRRVGDSVVAMARRDGSDREWHGRRPRGLGHWRPPPGSVARPVQPLAGSWRTWVLRSGSELRPGPPPSFRSAQFEAEAREVMATRGNLTESQQRIAEYWEGGEGTPLPPGIWNRALLAYLRDRRLSVPESTRTFALLNVAMADAGVAAWDAKYAYWSPRPENAIRDLGLDRRWKPLLETPFFPAYVSGHATYSAAAGEVLAYLFPEDAELFRAKAREATISRLYGGIHYRSDNEEGARMGLEVGRRVVDWARGDEADRR